MSKHGHAHRGQYFETHMGQGEEVWVSKYGPRLAERAPDFDTHRGPGEGVWVSKSGTHLGWNGFRF